MQILPEAIEADAHNMDQYRNGKWHYSVLLMSGPTILGSSPTGAWNAWENK